MKAIKVEYDFQSDKIEKPKHAKENAWHDICYEFNDDVHRIRSVKELEPYTGLYECIDDDNKRYYYIVEENTALFKAKHKQFYKKLGL